MLALPPSRARIAGGLSAPPCLSFAQVLLSWVGAQHHVLLPLSARSWRHCTDCCCYFSPASLPPLAFVDCLASLHPHAQICVLQGVGKHHDLNFTRASGQVGGKLCVDYWKKLACSSDLVQWRNEFSLHSRSFRG